MKTVMGVDPSSKKLAMVSRVMGGSGFSAHAVELSKKNNSESCYLAYWKLRAAIDLELNRAGFEALRVYLEKPVSGVGGPGATIPQAEVSGAMQTLLWELYEKGLDIDWRLVNNTTWKKHVIGNGAADKVKISAEMKKIWPDLWKNHDQDIIDAGAICLYGMRHEKLLEKFP